MSGNIVLPVSTVPVTHKLRLWANSDVYSIYMSERSAAYDTDINGMSSYNTYFRMGGASQGWVFKTGNQAMTQITGTGDLMTRGNVGIGTTSTENIALNVQSTSSTVYGDAGTNIQVLDNKNMAQGVGAGIILGGKYTTAGDLASFAGIKAYKSNGISGDYGTELHFNVRANGGNHATRLRLNSDGLGVLTTPVPGVALTVGGNANVSGAVDASAGVDAGTVGYSMSNRGINVAKMFSQAMPAVNFLDLGGGATQHALRLVAKGGGQSETCVFEGYPHSSNYLLNGSAVLPVNTKVLNKFVLGADAKIIHSLSDTILNPLQTVSDVTNLTPSSPRYLATAAGGTLSTRIRLTGAGDDGQEVIITRLTGDGPVATNVVYGRFSGATPDTAEFAISARCSARFIYDAMFGGWTKCE